MGVGAIKRKEQEKLQQAGVDTSGLSTKELVSQYDNGYSMITARNAQTANEYFQKGGTKNESGSFLSKGSSIVSGFMPLKKKTLLGGYLGSNAVLGG